jgi:predicted nucleic-acid-binding protein
MIGIDTNVLIRFIVQDDVDQTARAKHQLSQMTADTPGYINLITLAEVIWVMRTRYQAPRATLAALIHQLLSTAELRIERPELVAQACRAYETSKADFSDCLIQALNTTAGCAYTVTFDRVAATSPAMKLL